MCLENNAGLTHYDIVQHASHVTMSVVKLLARIVAPQEEVLRKEDNRASSKKISQMASSMHDHTYGINSDPLTQFACVFSALIHDAGTF